MSTLSHLINEPANHTFSSIRGHELAKSYLIAAVKAEILPHALLFHGPTGLGKLSMAYALTKHLNCGQCAPPECACNLCRKIRESLFADILVVEPKGAAGQITLNGWKSGKDDPDNLQYYRFIDTRPLEGAKKVLIIKQADRMNVALANHLLKLMEEPPPYLQMILLTHRRGELLTTIRSRCAPVKFSPLPLAEMEPLACAVLGVKSPENEWALLARLSEGRPGLLLERADESGVRRRAEIARLMEMFQQFGFVSLFRVASDLLKAGDSGKGAVAAQDNFEALLGLLTAWLRDAILLKSAKPETASRLLINSDLRPQLEVYSASASLEALSRAADKISEYRQFAARQTDKSYVLESLLMDIGRAMRA